MAAWRIVPSLSPREFTARTVRLNDRSDWRPDTRKVGVLLVMFTTLTSLTSLASLTSVCTTERWKTWARPPSKPGRQERRKDVWVSLLTEQLRAGSGRPEHTNYQECFTNRGEGSDHRTGRL